MPNQSAIPDIYYSIFAFFEPFLCIAGFIGTFYDPETAHNQQAPWPLDTTPSGPLPKATLVTILQLAHVCGLLGVVNFFVLTAARKHLHTQPALQEKIVGALLTPLVFADVLHLWVTLWALGEHKWEFRRYSPMLWCTFILGLVLLVPRVMWHLGIGRYVDRRDRVHQKQ